MMKKTILVMCLVTGILMLAGGDLAAQTGTRQDPLPAWFISLRDAVYARNRPVAEIYPLYQSAKAQSESLPPGVDRFIMLSRCEYMMGRAYYEHNNTGEAMAQYDLGMQWAQAALDLRPTDQGWQMLAENLSQNCAIRSSSYLLANGLKVLDYARAGLKLNPKNAACLLILAAQYIYAPWPFYNYQQGIRATEEAIALTEETMHRDDRFNFYSNIGYAYVQQKKYTEARPWLERARALYPSNPYILDLLSQK
ncbi:MAG: tetratricopeptide repeat protein [Treponema sp.]|jgi:tetratricopeptide (TPR) repeat protein|nr:tetratricopeptide repeat protein [Treponema sp.]